MTGRFSDGRGGFFETASDAPKLLLRSQDATDGVVPSGWSAAAAALLTMGALTGDDQYRSAAEAALAALLPRARRNARFLGWAWAGIAAWLAGPVQVAVILPADRPTGALDPLHLTALHATSPGAVVAVGQEGVASAVPLLSDRPTLRGAPTAYPCRGFVCDLPMSDPADLAAWLRH